MAMKKNTLIVAAGIVVLGLAAAIGASAPGTAAGEGPSDEQVVVALRLLAPGVGDFDACRSGAGVEAQYRRWYGYGGLALSVGMERWASASRSGNWNAASLDGHALLFPLGGSALGRWPLSEGLMLRGEIGLRYVQVSSSLSKRTEVASDRESIRLSNGVVFVGALGAEQLLTETLFVFGDVVYQHDLLRGRARTRAGDIMRNHLLGVGVRFGIQYWF